jgi:hypothetical protein
MGYAVRCLRDLVRLICLSMLIFILIYHGAAFGFGAYGHALAPYFIGLMLDAE